jgi:hypothetical protein
MFRRFRRPSPAARKPRSFRPLVESLEDRCLPSASFFLQSWGQQVNSYNGVGFQKNPVGFLYASVNNQPDLNPGDYQVQIQWGDGTSSAGFLAYVGISTNGNSAVYQVKGDHIYHQLATNEPITVTVTGLGAAASAPPLTYQTALANVADMPSGVVGTPPLTAQPQMNPANVAIWLQSSGQYVNTQVGDTSLHVVGYLYGELNGQADMTASHFHAYINWGDSSNWTTATLVPNGTGGQSAAYIIEGSPPPYTQPSGANPIPIVVYGIGPDNTSVTYNTASAFVSPQTTLTLSNASVLEFRPNGTLVGTLSASQTGSTHTYTYSLVSGTGSNDNGSFAIVNGQLVTADAFDYAAKSSYSIRVRATDETGSSFDQTFTIAIIKDPSLTRSGNVLTVNGTAGNDFYFFVPGRAQNGMYLNGVVLAADTATVQLIVFQGNGGSDTAYLYASSAGANSFVASPGISYLSGPGFTAYAVSSQVVAAIASPGQSATATLYGSAGNDVFVGAPTYAYLSTGGTVSEAVGFAVVTGVARAGGTDQGYLYGAAGGNTMVGTPTYAYLSGSGFWNQADGFAAVVGSAGPAGSYNVAYLYGSAGNDVFVGTPSTSYLYGSGFLNQANGFQRVQGVAGSGGYDLAYLYGSGGPQDVSGFGGSYFYFYGAGFFNEASGFTHYYSPQTGWL